MRRSNLNVRLDRDHPIAASPRVTPFLAQDGVRLRRINYDPNEAQSSHTHDFTSITLITRGDCAESSEHDTHTSQTCTVLIKPAGVEHANHFGIRGSGSLQLSFAPRSFPEFPLRNACHHLDGGPAAAQMLALLRAASNNDPSALGAQIQSAIHTVARAIVSAPVHRTTPDWVRAITDAIETDPAEQRSVADLAQHVGMHPVALARAFRRHCACSITEYLRRARILHATRRIANTDHTLADLAIESGFADQPHFTRAFRAELGCSPGEFRRLISVA